MKKPGFDLQLNEDSLGFSLGLSLGPSKQKSTQKLGPQPHSQALTRKLSRAVPLKSNLQLPSINVGSSKDSVAAAAGHCEGGTTASSEIQTGPERESRYVDDTAPYVSNSIHQMSKLKKRKEVCAAVFSCLQKRRWIRLSVVCIICPKGLIAWCMCWVCRLTKRAGSLPWWMTHNKSIAITRKRAGPLS